MFISKGILNVMSTIAKMEKGITPIHSLYDQIFDLCLLFNNFTCRSVERGIP